MCLVVGGGLLGESATLDSQVQSAATLPEREAAHASYPAFNTAGWVMLGVGAAGVVSGTIVFVLHARSHR